MSEKSYPIIQASVATLQILRLIGKSSTPTKPAEISERLDVKYSKAMTHIATLEKEGFIEEVDGGYIASLEVATFWAMRKALVEKRERELNKEKEQLGIGGKQDVIR